MHPICRIIKEIAINEHLYQNIAAFMRRAFGDTFNDLPKWWQFSSNRCWALLVLWNCLQEKESQSILLQCYMHIQPIFFYFRLQWHNFFNKTQIKNIHTLEFIYLVNFMQRTNLALNFERFNVFFSFYFSLLLFLHGHFYKKNEIATEIIIKVSTFFFRLNAWKLKLIWNGFRIYWVRVREKKGPS